MISNYFQQSSYLFYSMYIQFSNWLAKTQLPKSSVCQLSTVVLGSNCRISAAPALLNIIYGTVL